MWLLGPPAGRSLAAAVLLAAIAGGAGLSLLALVGLAVQTLLAMPAAPGVGSAALALAALLPGALELSAPVGLLLGALWVGRAWGERGQWLGLSAAGLPVRQVLGPVLVLSLVATFAQRCWPTSWRRGGAPMRRPPWRGLADFDLLPGQPVLWGPTGCCCRWRRAMRQAATRASSWPRRPGDAGPAGRLDAEAGLILEEGQLLLPGGAAAGWTLDFERATLPLPAAKRRVELAERSSPHLVDLIGRMRTHGKTAAYERLVLWKRSTLAVAMPLLLLLGLALGARGRQPGRMGAAVTLCWWALTRMGDQLVTRLSAPGAALVPLLVLALATALVWRRWRSA